jgi:predicted amidophosphoribosyltransferase
MAAKKKPAEKAPEQATVTCGDCDAKWPEETKTCPLCGYGIA